MGNSCWERAKNILCVRLDNIGDVLMTTPALRALKESCPGRRLTMLTSSSGACVAGLIPEIDEVIVYNAPWVKATPQLDSSVSEHAMAQLLREGKFAAAVIFTVYSQNPLPAAFLCYLADIPLRAAYCRENPYQLLTHWIPDPEPQQHIRHEVQRQLDLVASLVGRASDDRLSLSIPKPAHGRVLALTRELGVDMKRPVVVIHPGATAPSRRYRPESFARAARQLAEETGCQLLLTGTEPERDLVEEIRGMMKVPSRSLAGLLNLAELAALLALSCLLISNNTGPVHIAAALGVRIVDLYALTNPQHTPWKAPSRILYHDVPCKYCYKSVCPEGHHDCLELVSPSAVVRAAKELLSERMRRVRKLFCGYGTQKMFLPR